MTDVQVPASGMSELFLRALGRSTSDLIYALDRDGRYLFASVEGARVLGKTPEQMLGRTWTEIGLPPDREREFVVEREAVMAGGETRSRTVTFPILGSQHTYEYTISPIRDESSATVGVIVVSRDVTQRVLATAALHEQLRFRRAISRSFTAGLVTVDLHGSMTYVNPIFERMTGWSERELLQMRAPFSFWPADQLSKIEPLFADAMAGRSVPSSMEFEFCRRDGTRFPVSVQPSPLQTDDGTVLGWLAVITDIAEQKTADALLAASERRYRDLADAMPQIVWAASPDGQVDYYNRRWYEYTGLDEVLSDDASWEPVLHPDDVERCFDAWYTAVRSGQPYEIEYRFRDRQSGGFRWFLGRALPVRNERGEIVRWYGTCTDIEEIKRTQGDLRNREETLQRQNAMLQTLLDVSHLLSAELDLHSLVQSVTDAATRLSGAEFGAFFYNVIDEQGESYTLHAVSGVPREAFERFPMPRNTEIFGPTFHGESIVRSDDIRKDRRYGKNASYFGMPQGRLPVVSYLAVPVISKSGTVLGGLFFGHAQAARFDADSERLVAGLAAQAAVAIDNARLVDEAQKSAERLRSEEQRYRTLATAAAQIVWSASKEGAISGGGWTERIHPDDRDAALDGWSAAVQRGDRYETTYRIRAADGAYRWSAVRAYPVRDAGGAVREWIGTISDIDDRKRAEEASSFLQEASVLLTSSLDPRTILTRLGAMAVPRLADWCAVDVRKDDGIERLVVAHRNPEKMALVREIERQYATTGLPVIEEVIATGTARIMGKAKAELLDRYAHDERHRELIRKLSIRSWIVVPILTGGRVYGALTLVHAESGRRFSERDLPLIEDLVRRVGVAIDNAQLYGEAQAANRAKDEFLATLSHELRTPMTSILGWARLLKMGGLEESTVNEAIESIEKSARSQAQLIDDLLDVSRITLGKLQLSIEDVDLDEIVTSAVRAVQPAANAKGVRIRVDLDAAHPHLPGDPNRLQQVVWNLVNNAVKFTPPGGAVRVESIHDTEQIELRVSDTGEGMAPEFLPHIFDRFRQADSTTTRRFGGLGLGLAIVKQIIELHGGSVTASSEGLGLGATFRVVLPIRTDSMPSQIRDTAETARPDLNGKDVLVVDDDSETRRFIEVSLRYAGASVRTAASADEALAAVRQRIPDVLVSDIAMPGRDGYELIESLRKVLRVPEQRMPAVAITAFGRTEDRVRILAAGFQRYLMKPLDPTSIAGVVAEVASDRQ